MSIATEIQALNTNLTSAKNAVTAKGGTVGDTGLAGLADEIATIPSGGDGINREVNENGVYGYPASSFTFSLPNDAKDLETRTLQNVFQNCTTITGVNCSSLTSITPSFAMQSAFYGCTNLTSINFNSLATIGNNSTSLQLLNCFTSCTGLTSVSFPALTTILSFAPFKQCFSGCSNLTTADFSNLTTLSGNSTDCFTQAFYNCSLLNSIDFSSLATINGGYGHFTRAFYNTGITSVEFTSLSSIPVDGCFYYAFPNCSSLTSVSFPALTTSSFGGYTNQFSNMLNGCSGVTVHFPASIQATIGSWSDVTNGFGGTNTTVLFDL